MLPPVKIKYPDSPCWVVRVRDEQPIELTLGTDSSVTIHSDHLRLSWVDSHPDKKVFRISQSPSAKGSNKCSTFYLGEIFISDSGSILVYLEAADAARKDIITVINPGYDSISLKPHQVLEVVCFNTNFDQEDDVWQWEWLPELPLQIEQIGYRYHIPNFWDSPDDFYTLIPRHPDDASCVQHHFWLRFTNHLDLLKQNRFRRGTFAGRLRFCGYRSARSYESVDSVIDLFIDGSKKYLNKCKVTLAVQPYLNSLNNNLIPPLSPICRDVAIVRIPPQPLEKGCKLFVGQQPRGVKRFEIESKEKKS